MIPGVWLLILIAMVGSGVMGFMITSYGHYKLNQLPRYKVPRWAASKFLWELLFISWVFVSWAWLLLLLGG